jgi:hypothetical protein
VEALLDNSLRGRAGMKNEHEKETDERKDRQTERDRSVKA